MVHLKITVLWDVTQSTPVDTYQCSHHTPVDGILANATKILHFSHEAPHYVSCVLTFHCLLFSPNIFPAHHFPNILHLCQVNTNFSKNLAATWKPWMPDGWHWSKHHNKDQQISVTMEQNLVPRVAAHVGFVHLTVLPHCKRSSFTTIQNTRKISFAYFHSIQNVIFITTLCQEFFVSLY